MVTLVQDGLKTNYSDVCWNHIRGRCSVPSARSGASVLWRDSSAPGRVPLYGHIRSVKCGHLAREPHRRNLAMARLYSCSVDGCTNGGEITRGWCPMHYRRWKRNGDPLKLKPRRSLIDRFIEKIQFPDDPHDCWEWIAAGTPAGYGKIGVGGREGGETYAHRFSLEYFSGEPIPERFQIDHLCHNPSCVNPLHLEAVTPSLNCKRRRPRGSVGGAA